MNDALTGARCAGSPDPDLWFRQETWRQAKTQCGPCPVRDACLQQALHYELTDYLRRLAQEDGRGTALICEGVWGGHSGPERKRILDQRIRVGIAA